MRRSELILLVLLAAVTTGIVSPADAGQMPYVVREQDHLAIVVMGHDPPLTYDARVLTDGTISLPMVGRVPCAGWTLRELEEDLTARFGERLLEPEVSIRIVTPRPYLVYTLGTGILPHAVELQPGWRISSLIAFSGGIHGSPHVLMAELRRADGSVLPVNLSGILSGADLSGDYLLDEGDVLVIDDPMAAGVMVAGAVVSPGPVLLTGGRGAAQAIQESQGVLPGSDVSRVLIVRADRTQVTADLRPAVVEQDMAKDVPVGPGDLIIVPWARRAAPGVVVSGDVLRPGFVSLTEGQALTVGAAILGAAGGLGSAADRAHIVLLRQGKEASYRVPGAADMIWKEVLRAGDVVYVPRRAGVGGADESNEGGG